MGNLGEVDPFDFVVTNQEGFIQKVHLQSPHPLEEVILLGQSIQSCFDSWDYTPSHVFARKESRSYLLFTPQLNRFGNKIYYQIIDGRIWEEREAELKASKKLAQELETIIESSFDGIYITDRTGVTLKTNSAIERITGIPKSYYIGKNIHQLIDRGILTESVTMKVMEKKQRVSVVQKNMNGKETLMTGSPIFDEQGNVDRIVTNIRDLSELNQLNEALSRARDLEQRKMKTQLQSEVDQPLNDPVYSNPKMVEIYKLVERLASFDPTILILGETGVGKDVLVKHIYQTGLRSETGQLIKINCGAIPKDLIESELFGYDRGSFSGANKSGKPGQFELAHKGILFLDEIGEMPMDLQVKLLHAIQEKEIVRIGGTKAKKVDVQVIAATNKNLKEMVEEGRFREDLYYRLNVIPIHIPPLRDRKEDLLTLAKKCLAGACQKYQIKKDFDKEALACLFNYHWPGNVRELSNMIERLVLTVPEPCISVRSLPENLRILPTSKKKDFHDSMSLKEAVERVEKDLLFQALQLYKTTYEIAQHLETSQATIVRKLKKYHLQTRDTKMNN